MQISEKGVLLRLVLCVENGSFEPGTQIPGASVSEIIITKLFGIISEVENNIILF